MGKLQVFKDKSRYGTAILFVLAGCLSLVCTYQTQAQVVDFNLYVCQSCTSAPSAPTLITSPGGFLVGDAGNHASASPLLIIIGVYNGGPAPTLSYGPSDSLTTGPGGTAIYGMNTSAAAGTAITFNSSSGTAYAATGIGPAGGSQTFSNWNGDLTANSLPTATSFSLYVYELTGITLPANGSITIDESGAPVGSFVIGYACQTAGATCTDGDQGQTPDTTSGIIDTFVPATPEPSTMLLFGTGLVALGAKFRRRKSEQKVIA
jgi:PEP-CTERM motif